MLVHASQYLHRSLLLSIPWTCISSAHDFTIPSLRPFLETQQHPGQRLVSYQLDVWIRSRHRRAARELLFCSPSMLGVSDIQLDRPHTTTTARHRGSRYEHSGQPITSQSHDKQQSSHSLPYHDPIVSPRCYRGGSRYASAAQSAPSTRMKPSSHNFEKRPSALSPCQRLSFGVCHFGVCHDAPRLARQGRETGK